MPFPTPFEQCQKYQKIIAYYDTIMSCYQLQCLATENNFKEIYKKKLTQFTHNDFML